jgi:hypothetical protein
MIEIWKDIIGFEGKYNISNFGKVKSLARKSGLCSTENKKDFYYNVSEKILKPGLSNNGYNGSCWSAPDPLNSGQLGTAIGQNHYVGFNRNFQNQGYFELWVNTYNPGFPNIVPSVYLNGVNIGNLDLNTNDQVGSIFIAYTNTSAKIVRADFICPISKMQVYYFDPSLVKYGENIIEMKNLRKHINSNRGTIEIRNYIKQGDNLFDPCRVQNIEFVGGDGSSFRKDIYAERKKRKSDKEFKKRT